MPCVTLSSDDLETTVVAYTEFPSFNIHDLLKKGGFQDIGCVECVGGHS